MNQDDQPELPAHDNHCVSDAEQSGNHEVHTGSGENVEVERSSAESDAGIEQDLPANECHETRGKKLGDGDTNRLVVDQALDPDETLVKVVDTRQHSCGGDAPVGDAAVQQFHDQSSESILENAWLNLGEVNEQPAEQVASEDQEPCHLPENQDKCKSEQVVSEPLAKVFSDTADEQLEFFENGGSFQVNDGNAETQNRDVEQSYEQSHEAVIAKEESQQSQCNTDEIQVMSMETTLEFDQSGAQEAEPGAQETEPGTQEAEPGTQEADLGAQEAELGAQEAELLTQKAEPGTQEAEPGAQDPEHGTQEAEPGAQEAELLAQKAEPGTQEAEPGAQDPEPGTQEAEPGTQEAEPGTQEAELLAKEAEAGTQEAEPGAQEAEFGAQEAELRAKHLHTGGDGPESEQQDTDGDVNELLVDEPSDGGVNQGELVDSLNRDEVLPETMQLQEVEEDDRTEDLKDEESSSPTPEVPQVLPKIQEKLVDAQAQMEKVNMLIAEVDNGINFKNLQKKLDSRMVQHAVTKMQNYILQWGKSLVQENGATVDAELLPAQQVVQALKEKHAVLQQTFDYYKELSTRPEEEQENAPDQTVCVELPSFGDTGRVFNRPTLVVRTDNMNERLREHFQVERVSTLDYVHFVPASISSGSSLNVFIPNKWLPGQTTFFVTTCDSDLMFASQALDQLVRKKYLEEQFASAQGEGSRWESYGCSGTRPSPGDLVFVEWDMCRMWFRGRIVSVSQESAQVFLLDQLNTISVDLQFVLPWRPDLCNQEPVVIECTFDKAQEVSQDNDARWKFNEIVIQLGLQMHGIKCTFLEQVSVEDRTVWSVDLMDVTQENPRNILDMVVARLGTKGGAIQCRDIRLNMEKVEVDEGTSQAGSAQPSDEVSGICEDTPEAFAQRLVADVLRKAMLELTSVSGDMSHEQDEDSLGNTRGAGSSLCAASDPGRLHLARRYVTLCSGLEGGLTGEAAAAAGLPKEIDLYITEEELNLRGAELAQLRSLRCAERAQLRSLAANKEKQDAEPRAYEASREAEQSEPEVQFDLISSLEKSMASVLGRITELPEDGHNRGDQLKSVRSPGRCREGSLEIITELQEENEEPVGGAEKLKFEKTQHSEDYLPCRQDGNNQPKLSNNNENIDINKNTDISEVKGRSAREKSGYRKIKVHGSSGHKKTSLEQSCAGESECDVQETGDDVSGRGRGLKASDAAEEAMCVWERGAELVPELLMGFEAVFFGGNESSIVIEPEDDEEEKIRGNDNSWDEKSRHENKNEVERSDVKQGKSEVEDGEIESGVHGMDQAQGSVHEESATCRVEVHLGKMSPSYMDEVSRLSPTAPEFIPRMTSPVMAQVVSHNAQDMTSVHQQLPPSQKLEDYWKMEHGQELREKKEQAREDREKEQGPEDHEEMEHGQEDHGKKEGPEGSEKKEEGQENPEEMEQGQEDCGKKEEVQEDHEKKEEGPADRGKKEVQEDREKKEEGPADHGKMEEGQEDCRKKEEGPESSGKEEGPAGSGKKEEGPADHGKKEGSEDHGKMEPEPDNRGKREQGPKPLEMQSKSRERSAPHAQRQVLRDNSRQSSACRSDDTDEQRSSEWRFQERSCYTCGNTGHLARDCPSRAADPCRTRQSCWICNETGHISSHCLNKGPQYYRGRHSGSRYSPGAERSIGTCYNCNEVGHKAANCPLPANPSGKPRFEHQYSRDSTDPWETAHPRGPRQPRGTPRQQPGEPRHPPGQPRQPPGQPRQPPGQPRQPREEKKSKYKKKTKKEKVAEKKEKEGGAEQATGGEEW